MNVRMGSTEPILTCETDIKVEKPIIKLLPSKPTPAGTLFLSNIDLTVLFPVETIYFFQPTTNTDDVVDRLRDSLSDVLVPYHFMAGRLQFNAQDGRLELNCNRMGGLFAGASSDLTLAELGDVSAPNPSFRNLIVKLDEMKELCDTPLLTMQVTRFKCGGFCIGLVTSHCLMDGLAASEFLHNLASIARGEGLVIQPNYDRTWLKSRIPPKINYPHNEYTKLSDITRASSFTTSGTETHSVIKFSENHSYKIFTFSPDMLDRLKQKAMEDKFITKCSTFEVMVAHLWQVRTKAVFDDPMQTSSVLFAVNIRSKVNPPLPKGFVGNGILTASASASVQELHEKPLSYCVAKVQEAISSITDDYVRSAVDWLGVYKGIPSAINGNFFLSAWSKLPLYELDFGWGKPVYASPIVGGLEEFVLLLSHGSGEGLNVWIILKPHQMDIFQKHINHF
eukprot:Gb_35737 [translate_table: standard]